MQNATGIKRYQKRKSTKFSATEAAHIMSDDFNNP